MKNTITINESTRSSDITQEQGTDTMVVSFVGIEGKNNQLELYLGNEYNATLACRTLDQTASATLPADVFTGNNLHFRLMQDEAPGQFYHILCDPKQAFTFKALNLVIFSNRNIQGGGSAAADLNTYGDLSKFTQEALGAYTYEELRGGTLE